MLGWKVSFTTRLQALVPRDQFVREREPWKHVEALDVENERKRTAEVNTLDAGVREQLHGERLGLVDVVERPLGFPFD